VQASRRGKCNSGSVPRAKLTRLHLLRELYVCNGLYLSLLPPLYRYYALKIAADCFQVLSIECSVQMRSFRSIHADKRDIGSTKYAGLEAIPHAYGPPRRRNVQLQDVVIWIRASAYDGGKER